MIEHLVIDSYRGEVKPETFLVPQDTRQELWLPLYSFDISCHGKHGCPMTSISVVVFFPFRHFFKQYLLIWLLLRRGACSTKSILRTSSSARTSKSSCQDTANPPKRYWSSFPVWTKHEKSLTSPWGTMTAN